MIGWQPPPHNGRSHVVSSLTSAPFTTLYNVVSYDTKLQNEIGQRKIHIALIRAARHITRFKRFANKVNPDVAVFIIGPGISFWHDMLVLRQCHQLKTPTIVRFIGGRIAGELKKIPKPFNQFAHRQLSQSQLFLSETDEMNRDLMDQFPDIRADWTPNFIHEDYLARPIDLDRQSSSQVVFLGSMTPAKGVETVLGAVDAVNDHHETIFHFIGGESEAGYLDKFQSKAAQLRHAGRVKVHGQLSREQAHELCRQARIYTFPSQWQGEGQPASLIELMGLGLVPIVTRWRGLDKIVSHGTNGLTIDSPDSAALAQQILYLLGNPEVLRTLSIEARRTVYEKYTHTAAVNQYQSVYAETIGESSELEVLEH